MDNPFENPFEDLDTKWRLPEGETPHVETIRLLRTLGGSNEITNKELTQLAYFLNEHRDARHAWPGERLFHLLVGMFDHRTPTRDDRDEVLRDLGAIEKECARAAAPPPQEPAVPLTAIKVSDPPLPEVNTSVDVFCEEVGNTFAADLRRQSCACPGWPTNRSKLRHGDLRRCCAHMVEAYQQLIEDGGLADTSPIMKAVFADRALRGRSCDPKATWKLLKIKMRPYLAILRHHGWSYVYAPDGGSGFSRYAYEPDADRWSFGQPPVNHRAVSDWMRQELAA